MMTRLVLLLLLPSMFLSVARSQTVSRISEEGTLETLGLELKFNSPVINPEKGIQYATLDDIGQEYEHIRTFLEDLAGRYGEFDLIKQLPNEMWGDTLKNRVNDGALVSVIDMSQLYYLQFSDWIPVDEVLEQILELSEIEYAHPPAEAASLADQPNDPLYGDQWNLQRILAEQAWGISQGSSAVTVAIIESQSLPYKLHPDLENKWDPNKGEQGTGDGDHGTRVAGIIGAETNNETGIASLGWNLRMSRYAFTYGEPPVTLVAAIAAAVADTNRVINCSFVTIRLARVTLPGNIACSYRFFHSYPSVQNAISNAITMGVVVIGGAGNSLAWHYVDGLLPDCTNWLINNWEFPLAAPPAAYADVIAVSATGEKDLWAEGQNLSDPLQMYNYGDWVDIAAPGMYVLTTSGADGYDDGERGTSFSAPHVSALAGLILSVDSTLIPATVRDIITSTADKVDSVRFPYTNGWNDHLGYGRTNAYRALSKANGPPSAPQNFQVTTHWENWTAHPKLTWGGAQEPDVLDGGKYRIWRRILTPLIGDPEPWLLHDSVSGAATQYIDYSVSWAGSGMYIARYKIKAIDFARLESAFSDSGQVHYGNVWKTGEQDSSATIPVTFELNQNFPNPFNPSTAIRYALPVDTEVSIKVIDLLGREVVTLVSGFQKAGKHTVVLDASFLPSGVYFYQMKAGAFTSVKKLLLLR